MADQAKRLVQGSRPGAFGPASTFIATVLIAFAALFLAAVTLPKDFALAAISSLFFVFAAVVALVAWLLGRPSEQGAVTYWDVAGALTLFGIFAGATIDPDQLVRLVMNAKGDD